MLLIQIILVAILIGAIYMTWKRSKEQAIGFREAVLWTILWVTAAMIILLPQTTTTIANILGVGRGVDVILYASVILLFIALFRLHVIVERLERKLTDIVRAEALRDIK
ncbi:DUF2304 family protein [Candidatus Uhrbacteria bacterium]|nr:DUF2304 family protein [Candidatus Uhrbacteria bacterium]